MRSFFAAALVLLAQCSSVPPSRDGIMVVVWSDGLPGVDLDSVQISVNGMEVTLEGGPKSSFTLPTTLAIEGKADTEVTIEARAIKDGLLRVATAKKTTIPKGHASILDVDLPLACYDRCVQGSPNATLTRYCDPNAGAGATCADAPLVAVETLPVYRSDQDPLAAARARPRGCDARPYCTPQTTCASRAGAGAQGTLGCTASCRAVSDKSTTCDAGLASGARAWPVTGGTVAGDRRSAQLGPSRAPSVETTFPFPKATIMSAYPGTPLPVISENGARAYAAIPATGSITRFALDDFAKAPSLMPTPAPAQIAMITKRAKVTCCDFAGAPLLLKSGELLAVSTSGLLLEWATPTTDAPPIVSDVFKNIALACDGCARHAALAASGTLYVNTTLGLVAYDLGKHALRWGPIEATKSDDPGPMAIDGDGRVLMGRAPQDGIIVATPDGRAPRFYEGPDGVFGAVRAVTVDLDGTAFFGADYSLFGASDASVWRVDLGGPILSAPALGADGTVYALTAQPNPAVHAVDRLGRRKWTVPLRGDVSVAMSPIVASDGTIYACNAGGFIVAIAPNGVRYYESGSGEPYVGSPILLADKGLLATRADRLEIWR